MQAGKNELKAVIFDWAGTTVDYGSLAPTMVVVEIFRRRDIDITVAEARGPMGVAKRDHIAAIAALPRVKVEWAKHYGREPTDNDVDSLYDEFLPMQKEALAGRGSQVIPGVPEAIRTLRSLGLKIGSTTGYTRELMNVVAPIAAQGGYRPDVIVCSDEVVAGRPSPLMNLRAAEQLGVSDMHSVVVVDDTAIGVAAGRNAGACTIAVSQTGNAFGLSLEEAMALAADEREAQLLAIERDFSSQGAHLVIRSVAELPTRWDELLAVVNQA